MPPFSRGDVVLARLDPKGGAEKFGTRPCVIVQNDRANSNPSWPITIVVPITGRDARYPFDVSVASPEGGLDRDSSVDCSQVHTIDKKKILHLLGSFSPETMAKIEEATKITLDLP